MHIRIPPVLALLASTVLPAAAQEAPIRLQELVLGTGLPRVATETPQAVTVIDQDDIDRAQATTPAELFDDVPGIQAIGSERPAGISFNIRGIGELASSDESKIIVTVDGATKFHEQYRVGSFFGEPELYKRIEVLRGPASSTLYGAGAIGGVVAFETKDASDFLAEDETNALRFRLGGETNGAGGFGSLIWATRPTERAEFLAALTYRKADDYEDGDGNDVPGSAFDSLGGLVKGTFSLEDASTLSLSYEAYESDLSDTEYSQTGTLGFGTIDRRVFDQSWVLSYENPVPGNDAFDLDLTFFYSDTSVSQSDSETPFPSDSILFEDTDYAYETLGFKLENTSAATLGVWDAFFTYGLQASRQDRIAEAESGDIEFHPEGTDTRVGLYAQAEFIWNDRLTLIPGLRIDRSDIEPEAGIPRTQAQQVTSVSPKLAAHYQVTDAFSVFGSASRTERAPTIDELFSFDSRDGETPALFLEPEEATAFELGASWSGDLAGGVLGAKVTAFHYDIENLIERDPSANTPFFRQVGEARLRGIELEAGWQSGRFFADAAYTYVDGEDRTTGETLTSVPAENLALTAGLRFEEQGLEVQWQGTFVDDITVPAFGGPERFSGYGLHDVSMAWSPQDGPLEGIGIRLGVDNVFDCDYRNSLAGDDGPGRNIKLAVTRGVSW
jgi:hemoglobin/transferrin/lactoferrin receptor protein